mmetsp:Transcript_49273/g.73491  ORF Transcript_49273/g.73491 Transcript_49273/m.73491 type:complete len:435 (-) Transcript_49273:104-1408(-)
MTSRSGGYIKKTGIYRLIFLCCVLAFFAYQLLHLTNAHGLLPFTDNEGMLFLPQQMEEANLQNEESPQESDDDDFLVQLLNSSLPDQKAVFLYGAGLGTTGTHTINDAMGVLGLNSVHFNYGVCLPPQQLAQTQLNNRATADLTTSWEKLRKDIFQAYQLHHAAAQGFRRFQRRCLKVNDPCSWEETKNQIDQILLAIQRVIESPWIDGVTDTPYPYFPSFIRKVVSENLSTTKFGVVLTLRDSHKWMRKRSYWHSLKDTVCYLAPTPNNNNTTAAKVSMDLFQCYQEALRWKKKPKVATDVFTQFRALQSRYGDEFATDLVIQAKEFTENQTLSWARTSSVPVYSIDLFEQESRVAPEDIASRIVDTMVNNQEHRDNSKESPAFVAINDKTLFQTRKQDFVKESLLRSINDTQCFRPMEIIDYETVVQSNLAA